MFGGASKPRGLTRYLAPQEDVIFLSRRHVVVLARPAVIWLGSLILAAAVGLIVSPRLKIKIGDQIAGWVVIMTTAYLAVRIWQWLISTYVVTDQRVLFIEGIVARKVSSIPLPKVTETTYARSGLGRILGYGSMLLDSPGENPGMSTLTFIPRPDRLYRLVTSLVVGRVWDRTKNPVLDPDDTGPIPRVVV